MAIATKNLWFHAWNLYNTHTINLLNSYWVTDCLLFIEKVYEACSLLPWSHVLLDMLSGETVFGVCVSFVCFLELVCVWYMFHLCFLEFVCCLSVRSAWVCLSLCHCIVGELCWRIKFLTSLQSSQLMCLINLSQIKRRMLLGYVLLYVFSWLEYWCDRKSEMQMVYNILPLRVP